MQRVGCPVCLIRAVMALYEETRATVRTAGGFSPSFLIEQGTREGCLLSPLLFFIFFADAVDHRTKIRLEDGQVLLGALVAVIILFADDVVLISRSLPDLQRLIDGWGAYCKCSHEQMSLTKTKAMCFRSASSPFRILEGRLYRRTRLSEGEGAPLPFKRTLRNGDGSSIFSYEELQLLYRGLPVEWASIFKYLVHIWLIRTCCIIHVTWP